MRVAAVCVFGWLVVVGVGGVSADPSQSPFAKEFEIEVDATAFTPSIAWAIAGVTKSLQELRPLMTDKKTTLKLRPGRYNFQTTKFSFDFTVDLEGKLEYRKNMDQCVGGRGTSALIVTCSRPHIF